MVHEIREKNLLQQIKQSAKEIGARTIAAYGIMAVLFLVIGVTFILVQQRQDTRSSASYNSTTRTYVATFDGAPTSPLAITQRNQTEFDIQAHSRDIESWPDGLLPSMDAQHGPGCEGPTVSHVVDDYEKTVFNCRDHVMTAINGSAGYGQVAITPSYIADWKDGELVIKFDMSTFIMSTRDWFSVSVTPWEQNFALLESDAGETPDLAGPAQNMVYFAFGSNPFSVCVRDIRNYAQRNPVGWVEGNDCDHWDGVENYLTPSSATRSPFEFRITPTRITASLLNADGTVRKMWHDYKPSNHGLGPIPFNEGVVQFIQHSYTPDKDGAGVPATWHLDNISLSDATPFTMIKADKRTVTTDGEIVTFNQPAPANSMLRFHAFGNVSVSYDGGPYQLAQTPPHETIEPNASYFTPIPQGARTVAFKFAGRSWWTGGPFMAKDFAIWSRTVSGSQISPPITAAPTFASPSIAITPPVTAPLPLSELLVSPPTLSVNNGQTFTSEIRLDTKGLMVNGVETTVTYPSTRLEVVSVTNGTSFDVEAEKTLSSGVIKLAYGATIPKVGTHTIATVTFRAITSGTANVALSNSVIVESNFNNDVYKSSTNAIYTVISPTPTPTFIPPTPTQIVLPTPTQTVIPTPTIPPTAGIPGLTATYFNNKDLTNFAHSRIDEVINFNWGSGSPNISMDKDTFSSRWTGKLIVPVDGTYTIYTRSDDGIRVWIDNTQIINNWTNHSLKENSANKQLTQGSHTIRIEYYENSGKAQIQLLWSSPSITKRIIPSQNLRVE